MATKTQITTGRVRFSFVNVFTPRSINGSDEKYSVTLLIPKSDSHTMAKIKDAMEAAKKGYAAKSGKKLPAQLKNTIHDGDGVRESDGEPFGAECKGCWVMSVSSKKKPVVIFADKTPITDPNEFYSGCYGKAIINFFVYDTSGNRGISAGLLGVMKQTDGEPLGGGIIQDSDWDDDEDTEETPW